MTSPELKCPSPNENKKDKKKRIQGYVTFKEGKLFGEWAIKKKIDEGGFGKVYLVGHSSKNILAALKAEPNEVSGGSAIKLEIQVIRALNRKGETPHIPEVFHAAKHSRFCYMIMTLLGDNFKTLRKKNEKGDGSWATLSVSSWIRLAIQSLYGLKILHDHGYLHRDIKPSNFALGQVTDPERAVMVHLLDFGLARSFAFHTNGKWILRLARGSVGFRGTSKYASPNVHDKLESGRRDDLWSLFYVLIELHCGLPWQKETDKAVIEKVKCNYKDEVVMQNMPRELRPIIPELRKLDCYQRPDYLGIYKAMQAVMTRYTVQPHDLYDWEKKENAPKALRPPKPPAWYAPDAFFGSDPLGIQSAPSVLNSGSRSFNPKSKQGSDRTSTIADADVFKMTMTQELTQDDKK
ncbi:hypothetical protein PFISCL1PPCAC_24494 [Pristionchus fissidentatus]|uniref:Protein kinase domain-containing protein n=1 Tax=Pristionchus fissidentatus TaxID=1538716 RepID=A0AAV5WQ70_9BILA|nr:hypothetical protein PFISCL1PPCAC_24494 [Pristionchus fissidentatus]